MTDAVTSVVANPDWLPHSFDASGAEMTFVHVPQAARSELTFLSDEHYQGRFPKQAFRTAEVATATAGVNAAPLHFIFHTSFCSSTLLAKALELPGSAVSLREPDVLLYLANQFIRSEDVSARERLEVTMRLLSRSHGASEAVIVKPSNFANRLLLPALSRAEQSRAVLLYSDVTTLLRSLAKKGIWGRVYGRQLYRNMASWTNLRLGFDPVETFDQTDLQIAALAWLMEIHQFHEVARGLGPGRVMLLDSGDFMANVPGTLERVAAFFRLPMDPATARTIAEGPVFTTHSKLAQTSYSAEQREQDHAAVDAAYGAEIEIVQRWIQAVAAQSGVPLRPSLA